MISILLHFWLALALGAPPTELTVTPPEHDGGLHLDLKWQAAADEGSGTIGYAVLRSDTGPDGPWAVVNNSVTRGTTALRDKVTTDPLNKPPADTYWYRVVSRTAATPPNADAPTLLKLASSAVVEGSPAANWINTSNGHLHLLAMILAIGGLMSVFTRQAQQGGEMFIRRIAGIDAIEEGIGRATEMGRPVLYVPGIDELQDIQTIASMLILGQVSQTIAEYEADVVVSCCWPIVREVADEVVQAGFFQAGHPDAYNPASVRFISNEQFAFTAGTNGIIHREKPATNIYLGRFFAESLILAETGFVNKSIQIAGTAEATQLPFFIAACDYTLIGEELFAVSAYLSRDPRLVSSLKASDYIKVYVVVALILGTILATFAQDTFIIDLFTPLGGG